MIRLLERFCLTSLILTTTCIWLYETAPTEEKSDNSDALINNESCKKEIAALCPAGIKTDISVILCLQEDAKTLSNLSQKCHHEIWLKKKNLTLSKLLDKNSEEVCRRDLERMKDCRFLPKESKELLPCMIENKFRVEEKTCFLLLNELAQIIFADYHRLTSNFVDMCKDDIEKYSCGRLQMVDTDESRDTASSQGKTLECLKLRIDKLSSKCANQMLEISKLSSDDYRLDRPLYYACKKSHDLLCPEVKPGGGRVYDCLFKNKFHEQMSNECKEKLTNVQRIQSIDYSTNYNFFSKCKSDLNTYSCTHQVPSTISSNEGASLAAVGLCLEQVDIDAKRYNRGVGLKEECRSALQVIRAHLMSDYELSPEILLHCASPIDQYCSKYKTEKQGRVIHCLMDKMRHPGGDTPVINESCQKSVKQLLKLTQAVNDVRMDPVIMKACRPLLTTKCNPEAVRSFSGSAAHETVATRDCLLEHRFDPAMSNSCLERVLELQFFVMRDLQLDEEFDVACRPDVERLCVQNQAQWVNHEGISSPMAMRCLWTHFHNGWANKDKKAKRFKLSTSCVSQMQRILRVEAEAVDLHPRVHSSCLPDMALLCPHHLKPKKSDSRISKREIGDRKEDSDYEDEEDAENQVENDRNMMDCLTQNIDKVTTQCRDAVVEVMQYMEEEPDTMIMFQRNCEPVEKELCGTSLSSLKDKEKDVESRTALFHCMVQNKFSPRMPIACRVAIEHSQIAMLKDIRLTPQFKESCEVDARMHCEEAFKKTGSWPVSSSEVIECLSSVKTKHALLIAESRKITNPLSKACLINLRFEMLQRQSSLKLDPILNKACGVEIDQYCAEESDENGQVLSCLRRNANNLRTVCHKVVFARELEAAQDNSVDMELLSTCGAVIERHCSQDLLVLQRMVKKNIDNKESAMTNVMDCVVSKFMDDNVRNTFDIGCKKLIAERLEQRAQDYRLDPRVTAMCHSDISDHCQTELQSKDTNAVEYSGRIMHCLRKRYVAEVKIATGKNAKKEVALSGPALTSQCKELVREVIVQNSMDYHLDPQLAQSCQSEIKVHCSNELALVDDTGHLHQAAVSGCLRRRFSQGKISSNECRTEVARTMEELQADVHADPLLYRACAYDLQRFCAQVPLGDGRQMNCLLFFMDEKQTVSLTDSCAKELTNRRQMWAQATKANELESLHQLYDMVKASKKHSFFVIAFAVMATMVFIVGLCAGRVTKRVPIDVKNK